LDFRFWILDRSPNRAFNFSGEETQNRKLDFNLMSSNPKSKI
jgi:hypothetical protein